MTSALNWNRAATCAAPAPGVAHAMLEGLLADDGLRGGGSNARLSQIRAAAAELFQFPWPDRVIFTPGATYALNQAVDAIPAGASVLTTPLEHNSLLRPLHFAAQQRDLNIEQLAVTEQARIDVDALRQRLEQGGVDWLALCLASNVYGTLQPIAEICALAREHQVRVILDISQGGGQVEVDLATWQPAYTALPAHKGLHGPRGVGLLMVHSDEQPAAIVRGGTGSFGEELNMPTEWPGCMEAGTLNLPGIYGLGAALQWRLDHPAPLSQLRQHMAELEAWLLQRKDVRVLPSSLSWDQRLPMLSFEPLHVPPTALAALLEQLGLQVRAGNMCAAFAGKAMQTQEGLVRLSPPENADADEFAQGRDLLQQGLETFAATL